MNENLKPCPFCGREPDIYLNIKRGIFLGDRVLLEVFCKKCRCRLETSEEIYSGSNYIEFQKAVEELAEKWNKRCE